MMRFLIILFLAMMVPGALASELKIGSPFPGYSLANIANGESKSVQTYFGKKTILHVFASW